jgi:hypothetical protein
MEQLHSLLRLANWLFGWPLIRDRHQLYVIVYDREVEPLTDEYVEEYYGYFSTPDEARRVWDCYVGLDSTNIQARNIKLCRVVESWL